jgi:chromosome segregation ATPase
MSKEHIDSSEKKSSENKPNNLVVLPSESESKTNDLNSRLAVMQNSLQDLENQLNDSHEAFETAIDELKNNTGKSTTDLSLTQQQVDKLDGRYQELSKQSGRLTEESGRLAVLLEKKASEQSNAVTLLESNFKEKVNSVFTEVKTMTFKIETITQDYQQLLSQTELFSNDAKEINGQLKKNTSSQNKVVKTLKSKINSLDGKTSSLENEISQLDNTLKQITDEQEQALKNLKLDIEQDTDKRLKAWSSLQDQLTHAFKDSFIKEVEKKSDSLTNDIQSLYAQDKSLKESNHELINSTEKLNKTLKKGFKEQNKEIKKLFIHDETLENQAQELEQSTAELYEQSDSLKEGMQQLDETVKHHQEKQQSNMKKLDASLSTQLENAIVQVTSKHNDVLHDINTRFSQEHEKTHSIFEQQNAMLDKLDKSLTNKITNRFDKLSQSIDIVTESFSSEHQKLSTKATEQIQETQSLQDKGRMLKSTTDELEESLAEVHLTLETQNKNVDQLKATDDDLLKNTADLKQTTVTLAEQGKQQEKLVAQLLNHSDELKEKNQQFSQQVESVVLQEKKHFSIMRNSVVLIGLTGIAIFAYGYMQQKGHFNSLNLHNATVVAQPEKAQARPVIATPMQNKQTLEASDQKLTQLEDKIIQQKNDLLKSVQAQSFLEQQVSEQRQAFEKNYKMQAQLQEQLIKINEQLDQQNTASALTTLTAISSTLAQQAQKTRALQSELHELDDNLQYLNNTVGPYAYLKKNKHQNKLEGSNWFVDKDDSSYGIQLTSVSDKQEIFQFIYRQGSYLEEQLAYYVINQEGKNYFVLVYGNFTDYAQAKKAFEQLPFSVSSQSHGIALMSDIKRVMK